jgi:hypothetical protein
VDARVAALPPVADFRVGERAAIGFTLCVSDVSILYHRVERLMGSTQVLSFADVSGVAGS